MPLTSEQFRRDPERVAGLRTALELPIIQEALQILRDEGPETDPVMSAVTDTFANVSLGTIKGYARHHWDLQTLATHWPEQNLPEPTYAPEPDEEPET